MKRGILAALAATALVGAVAATGSAPASGPVAQASKACHLTPKQQRHMGASYVTSLKVFAVSCRKGRKVTKAYHECRKANGGASSTKCPSTVLGFTCKTKVLQKVPGVQFNAKMKCHKGSSKRVISTYTQNI